MKSLFVNGSPRKNWNTHKLLNSAMQGAQDAGADCELVHLYDSAFKGCVSCFACKLKNSKTNGLCAFKDTLTPTLEKARDADVIVIGAPVYFSDVPGPVRSFIERLCFPVLSYNKEDWIDWSTRKPAKHTGFIFNMNASEEAFRQLHYDVTLGISTIPLARVFGHCESLNVYETYQFTDYSRYKAGVFNAEERKKRLDKHFPIDLKNAYDLGKRLVSDAQ